MMTIKGFPFNVDHDTNYVTYAGNLGGVPENWHVEYCKGEVQPRTPEDLDLQPGWDASYFFFPKQDCTNDGYVVDGLTANYTAVEPELNWANTAAWSSGTHAGASFPTSNYQSKFSGQLRVIRGGQYMFSTILTMVQDFPLTETLLLITGANTVAEEENISLILMKDGTTSLPSISTAEHQTVPSMSAIEEMILMILKSLSRNTSITEKLPQSPLTHQRPTTLLNPTLEETPSLTLELTQSVEPVLFQLLLLSLKDQPVEAECHERNT